MLLVGLGEPLGRLLPRLETAQARFGFTEVRLGLVPATISPFVVARIGAAKARALFPTGEIFDAAEAQRIGLVDRVVAAEQLDAEVDRVLALLLSAAPGASREAKALADRAAGWLAAVRRRPRSSEEETAAPHRPAARAPGGS